MEPESKRPSGRLITPKNRPAPAQADRPTPLLSPHDSSGRTGLWTEFCEVCGMNRTHTKLGCTGCAGRGHERAQGWLYVGLGVVALAAAIGLRIFWRASGAPVGIGISLFFAVGVLLKGVGMVRGPQ